MNNLNNVDLLTISECIITKIHEMSNCYQIAAKLGTREAIQKEIDYLADLNARVCEIVDERSKA